MSTPSLLAVAHGSADPAAVEAHDGLMARIRRLAPELDAGLSYVDHTDPSVTRALEDRGRAGRDTVVVPLLLSAAAHARGDIPAAIRAARARRPDLRLTYARVLGPHPLLLRALSRRLTEARVPPDTAVVLAAAGSADPEANAEVARTARLLYEWRKGAAPVEAAFASATSPRVEEVLDRLRLVGHHTVAVAAYFLAPGRLPDAVRERSGGAAVTVPLADTDEVARLVLERYGEAVARSAPRSCDLCVYRAPWPGHEHRVGAVQRPHPHPSDPADRG